MYTYIYYALYKIAKRTEKKRNPSMRMPATIAMITISFLQFINLLTVFVLLVHGVKLFEPFALSKELAIFIGLTLYGINYLLFLKNKKFLKIEEKFDKKSKKLKKVRIILFWAYIILSFVLLFVVLERFKTVNR